MISASFELMERLPPLRKRKRPNVACLVGFLFGGIGLAIYFLTIVDFIFLMAVESVALIVLGTSSDPSYAALFYFLQCAIAGLYGFFRADTSNRLLEARGGSPAPRYQPRAQPLREAPRDDAPVVVLKRRTPSSEESEVPVQLKRRNS